VELQIGGGPKFLDATYLRSTVHDNPVLYQFAPVTLREIACLPRVDIRIQSQFGVRWHVIRLQSARLSESLIERWTDTAHMHAEAWFIGARKREARVVSQYTDRPIYTRNSSMFCGRMFCNVSPYAEHFVRRSTNRTHTTVGGKHGVS